MAELIVEGELPEQRFEQKLAVGAPLVLGKAAIPWERWASRQHVELTFDHDRLRVKRLPAARNPVFFQGREVDSFQMRAGDCFVIGTTVFTLSAGDEPSSGGSGPRLTQAYAVDAEHLHNVPFRDAPHRIDVLGHLSNVISGVTERSELYAQTVNLLLEGIRRADAIAIVVEVANGGVAEVRTLYADHRLTTGAEVQPSRRLVHEAVSRLKQTVVHVWSRERDAASEPYTIRGKFDWAFCTPLHGDACQGMGIYVAGQFLPGSGAFDRASPEAADLDEDAKFAELVATIISSLLEVQNLQHRQSVLSHFFSPRILPVLTATEAETALKPRETDITVMFCDLRGFSSKVEAAGETLMPILSRVSRALGVMSHCILEHSGAVADFLGDCAMGFWGWPLRSEDDVQQACLAAIGIRETFERLSRQAEDPLFGFMAGVGLATGHAVAGQIGSQDQAKVTVFGPCVNLASRLEGLTKILRVPILLDEATAKVVNEQMPRSVMRCRRLALVKPKGLNTPVMVSELLLPAERDPQLSDEHLKHYDAALTAFLEGNWKAAYAGLHMVPADDRGKDLLMSYILQHDHNPPPGWDGVIAIERKS
jgi:adenylate cyclase